MRKVILFNLVTLDGYFEGKNKDISWHNVDGEFNDFSIQQLDTADVLLFGRLTYELMASFWTSPDAIKDDPIVAGKMNAISKIVFSNTLEKVDWNNTRLVKGDLAREIANLKKQPGKDMFIFGSANLAARLMKLGLIDEYRILVNPIILGNGKPLFECINVKIKLKLIDVRKFNSGNVLLIYQPVEK